MVLQEAVKGKFDSQPFQSICRCVRQSAFKFPQRIFSPPHFIARHNLLSLKNREPLLKKV